MDRYDQELLDRQMQAIYRPPGRTGGMIVAILAIFLCGMIAGSALTAKNASGLAWLEPSTPTAQR